MAANYRVFIAIALLGALGASACSGGDDPAGNTNTGISCQNPNDCPDDQGLACDLSAKICVKAQCGGNSGLSCAAGQQCTSGICGGFAGGDVAGSDGDAGATDDTSAGDDAVVPADTGGVKAEGTDCAKCDVTGDCASGYDCVTLINGNFCAKTCATKDECASYLSCEQWSQDATKKNCIPPQFTCEGCAIDGCDSGEQCNFTTSPPSCKSFKGQCDACNVTSDCAAGHHCVKMGETKVCAPECGSSACPANSECVEFAASIKACAYQSASCCYGNACETALPCKGCPDKCIAGLCVDCTKDEHCDKGTCNTSKHACVSSEACEADKPVKLATGECVECSSDTHCAASTTGPLCIGNKCSPSTQNNECALCQAPYPGCVEINGTWSCVECATDEDCATKDAGNCSASTYTCSKTTGGTVLPGTKCTSDSDCDAGTSGFSLLCDVASGACYDVNGQCDNLTAFCNAAEGSKCVQMMDLFGGGLPSGGGGIPGIPGGGGGVPTTPGAGVCSCGSPSSGGGGSSNPLCGLCDCAKDPNSLPCSLGSCCGSSGGGPLDLLSCLAMLGGGGGGSECFGGSCLPIGCLFAGTGGGGSGSGIDGYCTAM